MGLAIHTRHRLSSFHRSDANSGDNPDIVRGMTAKPAGKTRGCLPKRLPKIDAAPGQVARAAVANATSVVITVSLLMLPSTSAAVDDRRATTATIKLFGVKVAVVAHKTIVLNDPKSPLKINAAATYVLQRKGGRNKLFNKLVMKNKLRFQDIPDGPILDISAASKTVVAAKFGAIFYDAFGSDAGGFSPVTMSAPTKDMRWTHRELNFTFRKYGVSCVFVRRVRLADGGIWIMDTKKLSMMMVAEGCGSAAKAETLKRLKDRPKGALRL